MVSLYPAHPNPDERLRTLKRLLYGGTRHSDAPAALKPESIPSAADIRAMSREQAAEYLTRIRRDLATDLDADLARLVDSELLRGGG